MRFGQELFQYLTTVVPYWRVGDEAWPVGEDHLVGIGVLRNYGGQVMVLPWDDNVFSQLIRLRNELEPACNRIIVVVDDRSLRDIASIAASVAPISVVPWSRRIELERFVINDKPTGTSS